MTDNKYNFLKAQVKVFHPNWSEEQVDKECEKILNGSQDDIIRPSFDNDGIRIEDEGLHYYHYMSISLFNSRDPVNVISKTPMSDDEEIDVPDYYYEAQERLSDKYEKY